MISCQTDGMISQVVSSSTQPSLASAPSAVPPITSDDRSTDHPSAPITPASKAALRPVNPVGRSVLIVQAIEAPEGGSASSAADRPEKLSEEEQAQVERLRATDRKVRAHEAAHASVGGAFAGSPSFQFVTGPNGQVFAVAGEVPIDVSPVRGDPEATIAKMQVVKAAALAPADPSSQDFKVAAAAEAQRQKAQAELNAQKQDELSGVDDEPSSEAAVTERTDRLGQITSLVI